MVAPYSGAMLAMVARSVAGRLAAPSPWNSTNLPTTFFLRSSSVTARTASVPVAPSGSRPWTFTPTTSGVRKYVGCPSMAASASMPPTPQPTTPMPFTIVVWESVPMTVSKSQAPSRSVATEARNSRFTWWQMPMPGGTMRNRLKACVPHLRKA